MKEFEVASCRSKIKGYPYKLTLWLAAKENLNCFIEDFVKYNDQKYGVIVKSPLGWAIFTKGERYVKNPKTKGV